MIFYKRLLLNSELHYYVSQIFHLVFQKNLIIRSVFITLKKGSPRFWSFYAREFETEKNARKMFSKIITQNLGKSGRAWSRGGEGQKNKNCL